MSRSTRAHSGPTTVVTLGDLEGSASSARPAEPDKPEVEPPRRSKRGRTARTIEAESLTPAEQDARTKGIDATLERAERAEKRKKRVEERSKRAIEKVIKADAEEARMKAQSNKRAPGKRREASLAFQQQREEKVEEYEGMYDCWDNSSASEGELVEEDQEDDILVGEGSSSIVGGSRGSRNRTRRMLFNATDAFVKNAKAGSATHDKTVAGKMEEGGQEGRELTLRDGGFVVIIVEDDEGVEHEYPRAWTVTKAQRTQTVGPLKVDYVLFDYEGTKQAYSVPEGAPAIMIQPREGPPLEALGLEERCLFGALTDGHNGHITVVRREMEEGTKKKGALLLRVERQLAKDRHDDALYLEGVEEEMPDQEYLDWGGDSDHGEEAKEGDSEQEDYDTEYDSNDDEDWQDNGRKMTRACAPSTRKVKTAKQKKAPVGEKEVIEDLKASVEEVPLEDQIKAMKANLEALQARQQQEAAAAFLAPE